MSAAGNPTTAVFICADDYALHPLIDEAVHTLAQAERLSGTSCMTTAPRWPQAAQALLPLRSTLSLGLHFNLTEAHGGAIAARPLTHVLLRSAWRGWSQPALRDAWRRQLDAFEDAVGAPPDFIDGHQHVHQFAQIRKALRDELSARYGRAAPWLRTTVPPRRLWRQRKALLIALLGGWRARQLWHRAGLRSNRFFAGVYAFDSQSVAQYAQHMAHWLQDAAPGLLLMCHPAAGLVPGDAIARQRPLEFTYLQSEAFAQLLQRRGLRIHQGRWLTPTAGGAQASGT